jgi:carboxy-cis,cis-muconate cyclase
VSIQQQRVASYAVTDNTTIRLVKTVSSSGQCSGKSSAFVQPTFREPYHVLVGSWPSPNACGMSLTVHPNGTLNKVADSWRYGSQSGIHGLAIYEKEGQLLLYSADLNGDTVWTHSIDRSTGKATRVGQAKSPSSGMHPRHAAVHPSGKHVYVVMEADNSLVAYSTDTSGAAARNVATHTLLPQGSHPLTPSSR